MADSYNEKYSKMRWYSERNRLAVVSWDSTATTVDSQYVNIPTGSVIRIYGGKIADHFSKENSTIPEIPEQFHEAIVYKAIATGYEIPPNLDPQMAMYFKSQYEEIVKKAKRWKKMGRVAGAGFITPKDF